MMIRDTAGKIQFWLKAGTDTSNPALPYGYTVNGNTTNSNTFNFLPSGEWQLVRQWTVTETQTVVFRLFDTGTVGLGGPTNLSVVIERNTVPDAPTIPVASLITSTSVQIKFTDPSNNGGSPIDLRELTYRKSTDPSSANITISANLSTSVTGLVPGTTYYFWARVHNAFGYSVYSTRADVTMLSDPEIPGLVKYSDITQTSVTVEFSDGDTGGTGIVERQVGYALVLSLPTTILSYSGPTVVTGLHPSTRYYFRSRTRNSVGWSDWSPVTSVKTLAGVRVKIGGVWRSAVPYVRVAGVWKLARPWGRQAGNWKEAS
jgi:titin